MKLNVKNLKKFILSAYSKKIFRGKYIERQKFLMWIDELDSINNFDELHKCLDVMLFDNYEVLNFIGADKCLLFIDEIDKTKIDMLEIIIKEFFTLKGLEIIEKPKTSVSLSSLIKGKDWEWLVKK